MRSRRGEPTPGGHRPRLPHPARWRRTRVVLALLRAFPEAAVHTLLYDADATFPEFRDARVHHLAAQPVGAAAAPPPAALPLLAPAASRMTVDADVTVVSTSGWAHGFDVRGRSVVYCHNPARWLYQGDDYLGEQPRGCRGAGPQGASPRRCAAGTAPRWPRHDTYLVNSTVVRRAGARRRTASTPRCSSRPPWSRRRRRAGGRRPVRARLPPVGLAAAALQERRPGDRGVPLAARRAAAGHRPRPGGGAAAWPAAAERRRSSPTSATPSCAGPTSTAPH